jgi:uncharacterized protein (DUF362 family)
MTARAYIADLTEKSYLDAVREGLDHIQFGKLVDAGSRVFLKPNLTYPTYRPGVMTSIDAVNAAVVAIKEYTPHISIGDADSGGYYPFSMDEVYGEIGMYDLGARHGVPIVNLSTVPTRPVPVDGAPDDGTIEMPVLLLDETDLLVTLPVPKIHMRTTVSLTFKNQWGCIPQPRDRLRLHPTFERAVLSVNDLVHAKVAIVDGMWGLNVSGPMEGDPVRLGWLLVADDLGAGARLCCELMQMPLAKVRHLRYAEQRGRVPPLEDIELNQRLEPFLRERFYLRQRWVDFPGALAFRSRAVAHLAYFSRLASALHKVLYLFREPFYDYGENTPSTARRRAERRRARASRGAQLGDRDRIRRS